MRSITLSFPQTILHPPPARLTLVSPKLLGRGTKTHSLHVHLSLSSHLHIGWPQPSLVLLLRVTSLQPSNRRTWWLFSVLTILPLLDIWSHPFWSLFLSDFPNDNSRVLLEGETLQVSHWSFVFHLTHCFLFLGQQPLLVPGTANSPCNLTYLPWVQLQSIC